MSFDKHLITTLEKKATALRRNVIISVGIDYPGHLGGSFSSADMFAALYFHKMKHDPKNRYMPDRDRLILSKGHIAVLQYAALAEAGYIPKEDLKETKTLGSYLQGHPDLIKSAHVGIEAGTGSLGQGLSIGVGMALALRMDKIDAKVYVIMGDGELAEGQNWEALMSARVFGLNNLIAIVDRNGKQAQGKVTDRFNLEPIPVKWEAFGWNVLEIDGHNMEDILKGLYAADECKEGPTVIISNTIKGKGLAGAESHPVGFHNAPMTREQYEAALADLAEKE